MDNQQPSSSASPAANFPAQSKQQATKRTVAQLLNDKNAMDDWTNNIKKLRQKESGSVTRHTSQESRAGMPDVLSV